MKIIPFVLFAVMVSLLLSSSVLVCAGADSPGGATGVKPVALQLYSLRDQFAKDVPGTLEKVRAMGFKSVELAGTYGLSTEAFKAQLDAHGLKAISAHFAYEQFRDHADLIVQDAKILGLEYAGCAWISHSGPFTEKTCREAIAVFNKAGETLAAQGVHFFYHTHGYEFQPYGQGTLFDLLMTETNPKYVNYEMDVFWIVHAGQDPVKLFEQYPGRWCMTHVKGMRDTTPTGLLTGGSAVTNDVPLGTGKIDFPPIFRAAKKAGVQWHIIEDESPTSEQQIPQSLHYLETVKW